MIGCGRSEDQSGAVVVRISALRDYAAQELKAAAEHAAEAEAALRRAMELEEEQAA